jgi:hypothetical protein
VGSDDSTFLVGWFGDGDTDLGMGTIPNLGMHDAWVAKLTPGGDTSWQRGLGGTGDEQALFVAVSATDEVLAGGYATGPGAWGGGTLAAGAVLARFDAAGNPVASRAYGASGDRAVGGGYLADGSVVAAFQYTTPIDLGLGALGTNGISNIALARLDASGNATWNKVLGNGSTGVNVVAIDPPTGRIAVGGFFPGTASFGGPTLSGGVSGAFVAVYASDGTHLASRAFPSSKAATVSGIAFTPSGGLVVSGLFEVDVNLGSSTPSTTSPTADSFIAALDATGATIFARGGFIADTGAGVAAVGVVVGDDGTITISGSLQGTVSFGGSALTATGGVDAFHAAFTPDGTHLWSARSGGDVQAAGAFAAAHHRGFVRVLDFKGAHTFGADVLTAQGQDVAVVKWAP